MRSISSEYLFVSPGSLPAVLDLLAREPGQWTPLAGGTELMVQFAAGHLRSRRLVSLFGLPELSAIRESPIGITIGAAVTYTALRRSPLIATHFPLLALAASWTGSIANQNRGTLGGNLVNGSPAADSPPALLVYEAVLELASVRGSRLIPYSDFHTGYKHNVLAPDELVLAIHLPSPPPHAVQYLRKVGARNAMAISKLAFCAVGSVEHATMHRIRIALASVSHAPLRCRATEDFLNGGPLHQDPHQASAARNILLSEIAPIDDIRSTARYRSSVACNLLDEFLAQLRASSAKLRTSSEGSPA